MYDKIPLPQVYLHSSIMCFDLKTFYVFNIPWMWNGWETDTHI